MDTTNIVLFLVSVALLADAQFTGTPQNQAVLKDGGQANFICRSDAEAKYKVWYEEKFTDGTSGPVTTGGELLPDKITEGYTLDIANNFFDLGIPTTSMDYAGEYRCQLLSPSNMNRYALLTILENDPACSPNTTEPLVEGETITYTCDVAYRGAMEPEMSWSAPLEAIDDIIDESVPGERTKMSIVVTAEKENNGYEYSCLTYFTEPANPGADYATNKPDYEFSYKTQPLVVHWSPRDVEITPTKAEYYPGEEVTCSGDSNPAIDFYTWEDVTDSNATEVIQEGEGANVLVMKEEWVGPLSMTLRCTVRNTMRNGEATEATSITFGVATTTTMPPTTPTLPPLVPSSSNPGTDPTGQPTSGENKDSAVPPLDTGAIVGIVFGCLLVVVIILLVIYFVCVRGRRTKEEEANNTRPQKPVPHDQVRTMKNDLSSPTAGPYDLNPPSYDQQYDAEDPYSRGPAYNGQRGNAEGLVYADLALDDTPRSRKPIQFGTEPDATLYADVRPGPGPMV